ncbi:malonate decarboxylase holo-ACP synthase [Pectobacterium cacticida]|uniref:malonate decarboxylase holo-ACP synthase n=1 Tax=Pectobacterium cacticida TaxID=69221 RepID=UPI002FF22D4B
MNMPRPHDLLWLTDREALEGISETWVASLWQPTLPVVVRRDTYPDGRVPVGVRGWRRDQRAAGWVRVEHITRVITPESLANHSLLLRSPFAAMSPVQGAILLANRAWPWDWGITGSVGYALATGVPVLHADSDLDLTLRCPRPLDREALQVWQTAVSQLPCRADTQVDVPGGAFALTEWLRAGRVLLKTNHGPRLVRDPWHIEGAA